MSQGTNPSLRFGIKVMPREVILDTQGRAVEASMRANGFQIDTCRVGKYIEVRIPLGDAADARSEVEKMLNDGGLYNPLIEKFEIQTLA